MTAKDVLRAASAMPLGDEARLERAINEALESERREALNQVLHWIPTCDGDMDFLAYRIGQAIKATRP